MAYPTSELIKARQFQVAQEEASPDLIPAALGRGLAAGMEGEFAGRRKTALEEAADKRQLYRESIIEGLKRKKLVKMVGDKEEDATVQEFADAMARIASKQPIPENYKFIDSNATGFGRSGAEGFTGQWVVVTSEKAKQIEKDRGVVARLRDGKLYLPAALTRPLPPVRPVTTEAQRKAKASMLQLEKINPNQWTDFDVETYNESAEILNMEGVALTPAERNAFQKVYDSVARQFGGEPPREVRRKSGQKDRLGILD